MTYFLVMDLQEFDRHFQQLLGISVVGAADSSWNGVQIACSDKQITRVACSVDASLETAERAAAWGADVLFVHHGFFWGRVIPVNGIHYQRVKSFLTNDLALYAVHLPLDMDPVFGNNVLIARKLGLTDMEPFGDCAGFTIGYRGNLPEAMGLDAVARRLFGGSDDLLGVLPFGPEVVRTVGILSGGGPRDVVQAIDADLDLFITGDAAHTVYHNCLEAGINVMFGGHYRTETFGVQAIAEYCSATLGLESTFIDVPTGL